MINYKSDVFFRNRIPILSIGSLFRICNVDSLFGFFLEDCFRFVLVVFYHWTLVLYFSSQLHLDLYDCDDRNRLSPEVLMIVDTPFLFFLIELPLDLGYSVLVFLDLDIL